LSLIASKIRQLFESYALADFFPASQDEPLARFIQKMLELNEVLNLTKWTKPEEVAHYHLLDSAFGMPLLKSLGPSSGDHWMDLGTGGGFPGALVLAAFPELKLTLVDSVAKKGRALEQCLAAAAWPGEVLAERAENLGRDPKTRESWNGVVARAVADFPVLLEYAIPLLKPHGHLLNWMTQEQIEKVDKAKNALRELNAQVTQKKEYRLPGLSQSRWIVLVEKLGKTDQRYPRPVGQPSKKPL
jgi:16S rRNA (guanine527-N7)-methyltransferase